MEKWKLKTRDEEKSFSSPESLLESIKKEIFKRLSDSPLSKASAQDPDGNYYDIHLNIELKERD